MKYVAELGCAKKNGKMGIATGILNVLPSECEYFTLSKEWFIKHLSTKFLKYAS